MTRQITILLCFTVFDPLNDVFCQCADSSVVIGSIIIQEHGHFSHLRPLICRPNPVLYYFHPILLARTLTVDALKDKVDIAFQDELSILD